MRIEKTGDPVRDQQLERDVLERDKVIRALGHGGYVTAARWVSEDSYEVEWVVMPGSNAKATYKLRPIQEVLDDITNSLRLKLEVPPGEGAP